MEQGNILWFDRKKGYGFISSVDGKDIYVHHSGILGSDAKKLSKGDSVQFDIVNGEKGLKAENVKLNSEE